MTYTFLVTYNSVVTEVFPLNWLECTLNDEKERDQVFYRRKFQGALTFGGKKLCADYNLFYDIHTEDPCGRIDLTIYLDSDIYWEGYFTTSMGEWNYDSMTFTVTPLLTDDYSPWDDSGDDDINILDIGLSTVTTTIVADETYEYDRNLWLMDVIEYLADYVFPGCVVQSIFFTDTPNYVTGLYNRLTLLTIAQKSDIKRWDSSGAATIALLSFNYLMQILKMFNVYWSFDGTTLQVEHYSYFDKDEGLDLTTQEIAQRANKYSYLKDKMPKYEKFSFMEAINQAFVGVPIRYDDKCVNQDMDNNSTEYSIRVTTDIEMIQADEDSVSDDGFVILANYLQGGDYYVYQAEGLLGGETRYNTDLSWSNLHYAFFRHGRSVLQGYMNNTLTDFASTIRTKKQEINAIICYPHFPSFYDPDDLITTELGDTYLDGEKGEVSRAVIHPYGEINFTLLYGETQDISGNSEPPPKTFNVIELLSLHNNSYVRVELSEPAPYDMYFWIYVESTNCDEFVVLEGEMWHEELITANIGMDPIEYGDLEYNMGHDSLDGWVINYRADDQTEYNLPAYPMLMITDVDCGDAAGGGTPPTPVTPTVDVTVKGGESWYIDNESGSISIGSSTLSITFKPHDCTVPGSHLVYIRVTRNAIVDVYDTVYCKEAFQCNKNISVTQAQSGDDYDVELSESSWT
jgi:hypothetical protein